MNFVLDASVAAAWCLGDEDDDYSVAALRSLSGGGVVVPHLWGLEMANVAERRGRISGEDVNQACANLLSLPIAVDPVARDRALSTVLQLARAHGLTPYDAAYLELAMRYDLPVATRDGALVIAAESEGVARWKPEEAP
ncbi:MAG TPA: PIN domain-containing protein [Gemmatimonadetes bacterium]|nr:PIN domain-containing protein [Gemmatimonadota bacterium]